MLIIFAFAKAVIKRYARISSKDSIKGTHTLEFLEHALVKNCNIKLEYKTS